MDINNLNSVSIKEYLEAILEQRDSRLEQRDGKLEQQIIDANTQRVQQYNEMCIRYDQRFADLLKQRDQQFTDLNTQLRHRFESQEKAVNIAFLNAEKATNSALASSDKAVNKAEEAQALRNEAANEFRDALSDLSKTMWSIKEGTAAVESLRRELNISIENIEKLANVAKSAVEIQGALQNGTSKGIDKTTGTLVTIISSGAAIMGIISILLALFNK